MNAIIIPAYQPNDLLLQLVKELVSLNISTIIVIDDGSQADKSSLFSTIESMGCHVIHHPINLGKGAAIKTGIQYAYNSFPTIEGYITCDADGQHQAQDILNVSHTLSQNPTSLILGSRDFSSPDVPKKSRMGNRFSSFYFKLTTGIACHDTQTGLRGIPKALTTLALSIQENRYDYEMTFLTTAAKLGHPLMMIPISTVYLDSNASSHFRPFVDSVRIYKEPIKFALSSLLCAGVDIGLFTLISLLLNDSILKVVFIATVIARIVSGILNFLLNRRWSFKNLGSIKRQFIRYFLLYLLQLGLSITFVTLLSVLPIHLTWIKLIVDFILFIGSFVIQKNWVFGAQRSKSTPSI